MSESSVSTSVNTKLTSFFSSSPQEFYSWFTFNMKLVVFLVVIFVLVSLVFFPASLDYDIMYNNINGLKKFSRGCPYCKRINCTCNEDVVRRQGRGCRGNFRGSDITMQEIMIKPILTDVVQEIPKEIQMEIQREMQKEQLTEHFSNDDMMSYSYERTSNHQSIPLLALFDENNNPKNLFFGKADRYIFAKDSKLNYRLEIYSNLLVLNGNVYDKSKNVIQ
jgi:thiol-disulfide isomerase/thioredoxin